jgi:hypothetical protein
MKPIFHSLLLLAFSFPLASFAADPVPPTPLDAVTTVMNHFGIPFDAKKGVSFHLKGTTANKLPCSVSFNYSPSFSGAGANLVMEGSSDLSADENDHTSVVYQIEKLFADAESTSISVITPQADDLEIFSTLTTAAFKDEGVLVPASSADQSAQFDFPKGNDSRIVLTDDIALKHSTECYFPKGLRPSSL